MQHQLSESLRGFTIGFYRFHDKMAKRKLALSVRLCANDVEVGLPLSLLNWGAFLYNVAIWNCTLDLLENRRRTRLYLLALHEEAVERERRGRGRHERTPRTNYSTNIDHTDTR